MGIDEEEAGTEDLDIEEETKKRDLNPSEPSTTKKRNKTVLFEDDYEDSFIRRSSFKK